MDSISSMVHAKLFDGAGPAVSTAGASISLSLFDLDGDVFIENPIILVRTPRLLD